MNSFERYSVDFLNLASPYFFLLGGRKIVSLEWKHLCLNEKHCFPSRYFDDLLINFDLILFIILFFILSQAPWESFYFYKKTCMFCPKTTQRFLVASKGFSFGVEIFGFFLHTASTVVTQLWSIWLFIVKVINAHKKTSKKLLEF